MSFFKNTGSGIYTIITPKVENELDNIVNMIKNYASNYTKTRKLMKFNKITIKGRQSIVHGIIQSVNSIKYELTENTKDTSFIRTSWDWRSVTIFFEHDILKEYFNNKLFN